MRCISLFAVLILFGCTDSPTAVTEEPSPAFSVLASDNPVGAIVRNNGEASPEAGFCSFRDEFTPMFTGVVNPNGNRVISCHWDGYPPIEGHPNSFRRQGFDCFFQWEGVRVYSNRSLFVRSTDGSATMSCTFQEQSDRGAA